MKRVLFYYDNFCSPDSRGGTEVATYRIAKALKDTGEVEVFHAYRSGKPAEFSGLYSEAVCLSPSTLKFQKSLSEFIARHDIDIIVNMGRFFRHSLLKKSIIKSGRNVELMFMQHFAPGSEMKKSTIASGRHLLKLNPYNPLYWIRASLYPLIKYPRKRSLKRAYGDVYDMSSKVILLSEGYEKDYLNVADIDVDGNKFTAIPNIFETENKESKDSEGKGKEKRVLILSRMDEIQKRLSLALEIWRKIEGDADLSEWHLDIVGSGHNMDIVKRLVRKLGLRNVTIHGWQRREPFLEKASILMMTSEYEGLPLSILEAQAYGVVPVAFDSFASLKDVVTPFETGVVVEKFGDIEEYVQKLSELMYDESYRMELSRNGKNSSHKFSSKKIASEWLKILT